MNSKDTNPKDAVGISKTPFSTLSSQVLGEVGVGMLEGALKYGRHNYRPCGVRASVYYDATFRHLMAWWEGQDVDPDSGMSHITKAIASLFVLRDSMLQENWVDDRPPRVLNQDWLKDLNVKVKALLEKYPDPVAPYTQVGENEKKVVRAPGGPFEILEIHPSLQCDSYYNPGPNMGTYRCTFKEGHEGACASNGKTWNKVSGDGYCDVWLDPGEGRVHRKCVYTANHLGDHSFDAF